MHRLYPPCCAAAARWGRGLRHFAAAALLFVLSSAGCAGHSDPNIAAEADFPTLPPFYTTADAAQARAAALSLDRAGQGMTSWADLLPAVRLSKIYAASKAPDGIAVARGEVTVTWGEVLATLERLEAVLPRLDAEPELLAEQFTWIGLTEGAEFSGYYESEVKASRTRKPGYTWPLYGKPADLLRLNLGDFSTRLIGQRVVYRLEKGEAVPYHDRAAIDGKGVLSGKGLEIAWVPDAADAYFLQVQGSGRLLYDDGTSTHVLYAADNGLPYLSLGRYLSDLGELEPGKVSMQSIRSWLDAHPDQRRAVLERNRRYVFFRLAEDGPVGSMGRRLTPWASLAVDREVFPLGAVLAFETLLPVPEAPSGTVVRGLGLAQDTGEAIRGRRIDLFCGNGSRAEYTAGRLNAPGRVWMLTAR